jgi:hypothetical protein
VLVDPRGRDKHFRMSIFGCHKRMTLQIPRTKNVAATAAGNDSKTL